MGMIGIIAPSEDELEPILGMMAIERTETRALVKFRIGAIGRNDVASCFSGVCKVNAAIATQAMIDAYDLEYLILCGVSGSLNSELGIGDVVVGKDIQYHDVAGEILTEYHPWMEKDVFHSDGGLIRNVKEAKTDLRIHFGKILTGEKFISKAERERLIGEYRPSCVDMESASFAHVCYANGKRFIVLRSITDNCDEEGFSNFEANVKACSRNAASVAASAFLL